MDYLPRKTVGLLALAIAAAIAACGGKGAGERTENASGPVIEFEAEANGDIAYTADRIFAKAGNVILSFKNPQAIGHVVKVEDSRGRTVTETPRVVDDSTSVPAHFKEGAYTFYCSTPGHRGAGMEGTLIMR